MYSHSFQWYWYNWRCHGNCWNHDSSTQSHLKSSKTQTKKHMDICNWWIIIHLWTESCTLTYPCLNGRCFAHHFCNFIMAVGIFWWPTTAWNFKREREKENKTEKWFEIGKGHVNLLWAHPDDFTEHKTEIWKNESGTMLLYLCIQRHHRRTQEGKCIRKRAPSLCR